MRALLKFSFYARIIGFIVGLATAWGFQVLHADVKKKRKNDERLLPDPRRYMAYLHALYRHKYFVYLEGRKLSLGIVRLLIHDWDKLGARMFVSYAHSFNAPNGTKWYHPDPDFDITWNRHQKISKHHWQAWVLMEDSGAIKVLKMPEADMREMLADWRGAGRAYATAEKPWTPDSTREWYENTKHARKLHPETQAWIETQLGIVS